MSWKLTWVGIRVWRPFGAAREHELAQDLVFDERENFVVALVFVMVAVDVDDEDAIQIALIRLPPRMRKQPAGIKLIHRHPSAAVSNEVHGISPGRRVFVRRAVAQSSVQL
jgi:hypothetical protein